MHKTNQAIFFYFYVLLYLVYKLSLFCVSLSFICLCFFNLNGCVNKTTSKPYTIISFPLKKDTFKAEQIEIKENNNEVTLTQKEFQKLVINISSLDNAYQSLYSRAKIIIEGLECDIKALGGEIKYI